MLSDFLTVGQQVVILFILIGAGFASKKAKLISDNAVKGMTNLVLYLATPCIIISSFQNCKFNSEMLVNLLIMTVEVVCIHIGSIVIANLVFRDKDMSRRAVFRVATIYSNCGFMSLPLQQAILGSDGVFYGAIYVGIFNLVVWTHGLVTMSGDKKDLSVKKLIANPGVIGVVIAIFLWVMNITLPEIISSPMNYLASLNTPVPMIIIGCQLAGVNFAKAFSDKRSYLSIGLRLLIIPALSLFLMYLCGMRGSMLVASVIATSAPSAATTTMFATKFDRDVTLSVSLVSTTTLFSIITMPLMVALSQNFA